ncbi:MAG: HAD family phosphatase [Chlamydiae bacterium]|nr:HAD family phosphatase [Chlamydiota bacterium]
MANPVSSNIKAIIFDCDGTLVDSEEAHLSAWERVIKDYGKQLDWEERLHFIGKSDTAIAKALTKKIASRTAGELWDQKEEYFSEYLYKGLPPIEGTIAFVNQLIQKKDRLHLKLAVASAATKKEILINLRSLGIENAFDLVLSGHDDLHEYDDPEGVNKPKPYIYLHAAKLLGISPKECVVIEDSHTGVTSAISAGCITVAVPNAMSKSHDLSNATVQLETLADLSVEDFLELVRKKKK